MRSYAANGKLTKIVCNQCGRMIKIENGIPKEGVFQVAKAWEYFSEKDGQIDCFDLCESCYDVWTAGFSVPLEIKENTELLGS